MQKFHSLISSACFTFSSAKFSIRQRNINSEKKKKTQECNLDIWKIRMSHNYCF